MTSLYIYYRVRPEQADQLLPAVVAMQARLRKAMPGLAATVLQRADAAAANTHTWMETYHFNGHADERAWDGLERALGDLVAQLPPGIDGARHAERFIAIAPLARES